jgi:hypothetical protein
MMKIEGSGSKSGSGSISQRHGSADPDPDPHQNVMDPQHCLKRSLAAAILVRPQGVSLGAPEIREAGGVAPAARALGVGCPSKLVSIRNNRNKEPKLVSALSETKRLFRLFRFYTETESFGVSIELKQTDEQPKQCDREHILVFFRKFRVFSVCFGLFRNSSFRNL